MARSGSLTAGAPDVGREAFERRLGVAPGRTIQIAARTDLEDRPSAENVVSERGGRIPKGVGTAKESDGIPYEFRPGSELLPCRSTNKIRQEQLDDDRAQVWIELDVSPQIGGMHVHRCCRHRRVVRRREPGSVENRRVHGLMHPGCAEKDRARLIAPDLVWLDQPVDVDPLRLLRVDALQAEPQRRNAVGVDGPGEEHEQAEPDRGAQAERAQIAGRHHVRTGSRGRD